jgi:beta-glucosidase
VLGPNAVRFSAQGGGSAHVEPGRVVTPVEGLRRALGDGTELVVRAGVYSHARLAPLPLALTADPETGEPGVRLDFLDSGGALLVSEHRSASSFVFLGGVPAGTARIVLRARVTPAGDGVHTFAIAGVGEYEMRVGEVTTAVTLSVDGGDPVEGMLRPPEHRVEVDLPAGAPVPVELRHTCAPGRFGAAFGIGHHEPHLPEDEELAAAVAAARDADAAVVIVGTNDDVESEGFDRTSLALPGRQDELVSAVAAVNPRTIVVVNAGAPVLMPWRDDVAAVLWAWLPGQEGGDAIADVLTGAAEPGGRLPTTFPASGDGVLSPIPSEDGTLDYAEGTAIGYRHYTPAQVAYPFGHGLGYTTWVYESLTHSGDVAEVTVRNTGSRAGREVVQLYATAGGTVRLAGFAVAEAAPGASVTVAITPDERLPVPCTLRAGRSAAALETNTTRTDIG